MWCQLAQKTSARGAMQLAQKPVNVVSTSPNKKLINVVGTSLKPSERGVN